MVAASKGSSARDKKQQMSATQKQISYLLSLLAKAGYSTRFMDSRYKALGATMRERSGTVEGWLKGKTAAEASALIDQLKRT
jgi:hypothetical protein